ncbi:autotransporter outer membrane beta-barrel domain-containing protein [Bartonella doshiae]|uniref:Type V secretory pathway, adhesin AidA n=3 Tax=Bartonella doshiae TaxID=33044 RepID=A0A380ZC93_BARDO|nr:autotransporter outer membrane beta-barrel domain-containing protein [Bartonella doshiae]SUV44597.1 Type V secretory pathway, adhesin AidA [Bartonella doshiae]
MFKKSLLSCTAIAAIALFGTHFNAQAESLVAKGEVATPPKGATYETLEASEGGKIYGTDLTLVNDKLDKAVVYIDGRGSVIELYGTTIQQQKSPAPNVGCSDPAENDTSCSAVFLKDGAHFKMIGGSITSNQQTKWGIYFGNGTETTAELKNVDITTEGHGIDLNGTKSELTLENVRINGSGMGIYASGVEDQITMSGGFIHSGGGVWVDSGSTAFLNDVEIIAENTDLNALFAMNRSGDKPSKIVMTGGSIKTENTAFYLFNGAQIDATDVIATTKKIGIHIGSSQVNLTNTKLSVENGIGIETNGYGSNTVNLKNTEIHADVLLRNNGVSTLLTVDHSSIEGRVETTDEDKIVFDLKNGAKWIIKNSAYEKDKDGHLVHITQRSRSDVSVLNLNNSTIAFENPTEEHYHTLHIGTGKAGTEAVYNASGDARIGFNIAWGDETEIIDGQKSDRLLIHGDVAGTTTVYIQSDLGERDSVVNAGSPSNAGGLSLIQVSGNAKEDSFKLDKGYTTLGRKPYKYTLTAYGPTSSHGKANSEKNLFGEKNENFWDFRLHKAFLDSGPGLIPVPVAQTASYIVMPSALFTAGFTDMLKQSALLADTHTAQNYSFFLSPYGNTATLTSERGALKYGYNADIFYAATQAGVTSAAIENKDFTIHLGALGTYGQLSFTPQNIEDAAKSTLNKWAATAYGSIHHNNGLYLDILASYGMIDGNITTAVFKSAAKLNNTTTFSASATVGKEFATDAEGVNFEPQVQLIYQQLSFDTIKDADNLKIDMKNPSQWLARIGGRLSKTVSTENDNVFSFYGKVNFLKTFGDDGKIQIGDIFDLDPMGASLEGGVGINAHLSQNFSIHGDVSYQQKLQETGITGASFSGGIRYQF